MAYGDHWKTKVILDVEIKASDRERAEKRWQDILEKIKYQTPNVKVQPTLEPNWTLVEEDNETPE
jgi:hypothetical protein